MSLLKVDTIRNRTSTGAPEFDFGINVISGISSIGGVKVQSGVITSITNTGIVTYYGDGSGLTLIGNSSLSNSTISGVSLGSNLKNLTPGSYITGSVYNGGTARTFAVDATSANTANKVVARDSNGDFSSRYITATQFIKSGGTSSQFLKADGSVDGTTYLTSTSIGNGKLTLSAGSGITLSSTPEFTANQSSNKTITVSTNATSANTANTIVSRGSSGEISIGALTASTGSFSGAVSATSFSVSGESGFLKADGTIDNSTYLTNVGSINDNQITFSASGSGISLSSNPSFTLNQSSNKTITISIVSSSSNTTSSLVFRDTNGDFSANEITAVDFNTTSDLNLKTDIQKIDNAFDVLSKIDGYKFKWKNNNKQSLGVIAQEVEKIIPELVNENDNKKTVNYNGLIAILIESIKELKSEIEILKNK